jgi:hypothetical protein
MTDTRKVVLSIVASVVVVGLVLTLVLTLAIIPLPEYPDLADDPDSSIVGAVAFIRRDDGQCISTIPAGGGAEHEVLCDEDIGFGEFAPGWTPDGLLVVQEFGPSGERFLIIDPETGDTVDRVPFDRPEAEREPISREPTPVSQDGSTVFAEGGRGEPRLLVESAGGTERTVLEAEGPADYRFEWVAWSPDGRWILLQDSEGRLIVVSAQGDPNPRILAEDIDGWMAAAWFIPGYVEGTWDPRG